MRPGPVEQRHAKFYPLPREQLLRLARQVACACAHLQQRQLAASAGGSHLPQQGCGRSRAAKPVVDVTKIHQRGYDLIRRSQIAIEQLGDSFSSHNKRLTGSGIRGRASSNTSLDGITEGRLQNQYRSAHRWHGKRHYWKGSVSHHACRSAALARFWRDFACNWLSVQVLRFGAQLAYTISKSVRRSAGWTSRAGTRGTAVLFVRNRKINGTVSAGPTRFFLRRPASIVLRSPRIFHNVKSGSVQARRPTYTKNDMQRKHWTGRLMD